MDTSRLRQRDSHDLSVQLTRYSVVDSMLLSLSGLPGDESTALPFTFNPNPNFNQAPYNPDDDPYVESQPVKQVRRPRGHTYSSSMSDYEPTNINDTASRYTAYHANARANAPGTRSRKHSRTEGPRDTNSFPPPSSYTPSDANDTSVRFQSKPPKTHLRQDSEGSGVDMVHGRDWQRAAILDQSTYETGLRMTPKRAPKPPPLKTSQEPVQDYAVFEDAAPTPTVPGGPRRRQESLPAPSAPATPKKGPSRQNSVKSSKTMKRGKTSSGTQETTIRDQARQFVSATNSIRNAQAAAAAASGAPSPTVGGDFRKAIASPTTQAPPKERPGFFRKFFSSSKVNQQSNDENTNPNKGASSSTSDRPKTQPSQAPAHYQSSASRPPTQDPHSNSRADMPQTLRKSTSSFFRRRKKSVSENAEVPPVPLLQLHQYQQSNAAFNRLSLLGGVQKEENSLRNMMAQYLEDDKSRTGQNRSGRLNATGLEGDRDRKEKSPSEYGTLDGSNRVVAAANMDSSRPQPREGDSGNPQQASSVRSGTAGGVNMSKPTEIKQNTYPSYRNNGPSKFLSEGAIKALQNIDSQRRMTESPEPIAMAPMPSRPPPEIPVSPGFGARSSGPGGSITPRTLLSPISDRSFLNSDASTPQPRHSPSPSGDDEFVVRKGSASNINGPKSPRVWLHPSASEEQLKRLTVSSLLSSQDHPSPSSTEDAFASATSLPIVQVDSQDVDMAHSDPNITQEDRHKARQIFEGDESLVTKALAASWLGQTLEANTRTRTAYMELFDWGGLNVLAAFRELCSRLVVRAESQQLDRIIDAFSERWCQCNPNNGFKDRGKHMKMNIKLRLTPEDVVHTIAFSILMLNTDLHLAEHDQHMTRSQFVKNTLPTIRNIADIAIENNKADKTPVPSVPNTPLLPHSHGGLDRPSTDTSRNKSRPLNVRGDSEGFTAEPASMDGCNFLVSAPFDGTMKAWESQLETILKDFYNSIRSERLPLHGSTLNDDARRQQSSGSLSVMASALRRTPSVLSKSPSENASFRGRPGDMKSSTGRFTSKSRTRRLYPSSTVGSSRTSLDDQSLWSPAASTWTKYSLGKTQTTFSVESLGNWGRGTGFPQAVGFANVVNQAMMREEGNKDGLISSSDSVDFGRSVPLLEDESLEIHGPPWAKEGLVRHKIQDKRTKDRGWTECFAVIEKGQMRLFSFTGQQASTSMKGAFQKFRHNKSKPSHGSNSSGSGQVKGGGNWLEQAQDIASFTLRQTYATTLAKEHSKTQTFVWALTLPTGAVHAFAVGSGELREEWISTANYWSARLSKEPLMGGVSNIEYGWGELIISNVGSDSASVTASPPQTATSSKIEASTAHSRSASRSNSIVNETGSRRRSSNPYQTHGGSRPPSSLGRGSFDQMTGPRQRLPGDKVVISEWRPPVSSMMASQLMEVDQRNALQAYVTSLDDELKKHNELRPVMSKAFSQRHPNATKAINNWNHKCHYLHTEIFKYRTYIEALNNATKSKEKIYAEREEAEKARAEQKENDFDGEQLTVPMGELETPISTVDPGADLERLS